MCSPCHYNATLLKAQGQHPGFHAREWVSPEGSQPRRRWGSSAATHGRSCAGSGERTTRMSLQRRVSLGAATEAPVPEPHGRWRRRSQGDPGRQCGSRRAHGGTPSPALLAQLRRRLVPARGAVPPAGSTLARPQAAPHRRREDGPAARQLPGPPEAPAPTCFCGAFSSAGAWYRPGRRSCAAPGTTAAPPPPGRPTCCRRGPARPARRCEPPHGGRPAVPAPPRGAAARGCSAPAGTAMLLGGPAGPGGKRGQSCPGTGARADPRGWGAARKQTRPRPAQANPGTGSVSW